MKDIIQKLIEEVSTGIKNIETEIQNAEKFLTQKRADLHANNGALQGFKMALDRQAASGAETVAKATTEKGPEAAIAPVIDIASAAVAETPAPAQS